MKLFGSNYIKAKNLNLISMKEGDINKCSTSLLNNFLKSDIYIVTGSSFIKGELAKFLIKNKALSIHMGLAPYYRELIVTFGHYTITILILLVQLYTCFLKGWIPVKFYITL